MMSANAKTRLQARTSVSAMREKLKHHCFRKVLRSEAEGESDAEPKEAFK